MRTPKIFLAFALMVGLAMLAGCSGTSDVLGGDPGDSRAPDPKPPSSSPEFNEHSGGVADFR